MNRTECHAALLLAFAAFGVAMRGAGVERDVAVPMRDGVVLRADVYRPDGPGPHPVLVLRTPYGKHGGLPVDAFLRHGYIVVKQDARGRYASDGRYESMYAPPVHEGPDGYDTVEWAARLPGANGQVGTFGLSYDAFLQWRLAPLRPPSLVAMAARSIPPRLTQIEGPGTIRPGRRLDWYYCGMAPDMRRRSGRPGPATKEEARRLWDLGLGERFLYFLPWSELPAEVFENDDAVMKAWLRTPHVDHWQLLEGCRDIAVPNFDVVGWFDHCNDSIEFFSAMQRDGRTPAARDGQRLIIGPWSHATPGKRKQGEIDFGPDADLDILELQARWFDQWIKRAAPDPILAKPVRYFVMGANRWRGADTWPPAGIAPAEFHLATGGSANTPRGDGRLGATAAAAGRDSYEYDPRNPVPTLWSAARFTLPADQRPLADRRDILVYQTEPLAAPLEIAGYPEVVLHVQCSTPDTDLFARLIDVAPDGRATDVAMGMVRARHRHGLDRADFLAPDAVTELRVRLRPTAVLFRPGHRIRLDVTSSDFPNYDRNHNTAADPNSDSRLQRARITLHSGGARPSRLILPVTPTSASN